MGHDQSPYLNRQALPEEEHYGVGQSLQGPINWTILLYQGNGDRREISLHAERNCVANFRGFI